MPHVFFVGGIEKVELFKEAGSVSVSFAVVPGNGGWYKKDGIDSGETQTNVILIDFGFNLSTIKLWRSIFHYPK